jgi:hypothetical protein
VPEITVDVILSILFRVGLISKLLRVVVILRSVSPSVGNPEIEMASITISPVL